jgi:hypothetical protein
MDSLGVDARRLLPGLRCFDRQCGICAVVPEHMQPGAWGRTQNPKTILKKKKFQPSDQSERSVTPMPLGIYQQVPELVTGYK